MSGPAKADGGYGLDAPESIAPFLNGVFPAQAPGTASGYTVTRVFPQLQLGLPTYMAPYPGANKFLVAQKNGLMVLFDNSPAVTQATTFLDLSAATFIQSDSGLTYFAFHPDFGKAGSPNRGYLYVTYKWKCPLPGGNGHYAYWRLSRFTVPDGQLAADPASEVVYIQQFDRDEFHDCGCLLFGPDGFLYVGTGDEGDSNDNFHDSQKINDRLFSGILRIDVNQNASLSHAIRRQPQQVVEQPAGWPLSFTQGYSIPNDNPFLDVAGGKLEEFYAIGFRNPYRFNYDAASGLIFVGDVGQDTREELDVLEKGANYGWAFREGKTTGPQTAPATVIGTLTDPIWDYPHGADGCIVGGYVYRGQEMPGLLGKFIAVDNVSGKIWAITPNYGVGEPQVDHIANMPSGSVYSGTSSLAQDANGELYFIKITGLTSPAEFYKLTPSGATGGNPPALLSQTGAFSSLTTLTPAAGLIPYGVNSPLWSDGAAKKRWMALPNTGGKIRFAPDAEWSFPVGTVFVKHFELPTNETLPNVTRRVETRFLVISASGEPYGVTYRWRPDRSDADLLTAAASEAITIQTAGGAVRTQTWTYPSRSDCMVCHNANANYVLGVKTHQLNGDFTYPATGRTANQLLTLDHIGWFDAGFRAEHLPFFLKSYNVADTSVPLESRVRSYLDANCAQCHRPNATRAHFDARYTTSLANQGLIYGALEATYTGSSDAVIQPADPAHSMLYYRANRVGTSQMPPLAKNMVDTVATQAISNWINSLGAGPSANLATPAIAHGPFAVNVVFNQAVTGLSTNSFVIRHGNATALTGGGTAYVLTVTPTGPLPVTVDLPAGAARNAAGLPSYAAASVSVTLIESDLVTWLKLDETSGTVAADSSLNNNPGALANGPATPWIAGHLGGALNFVGAGENLALRNVIPNDFTISFWLRTTQAFPVTDTAVSGIPLFSADIDGGKNDFIIGGTRSTGGVNRVTFETGHTGGGPNAVAQGLTSVNTGGWVHVAAVRTRANGQMRLYVNGAQEAFVTGGTDNLDSNKVLTLGANPNNPLLSLYYVGALDEVRIYNRALSATEVLTLKNATVPVDYFAQWAEAALPGLTHLQSPGLDPDGDGRTNADEFFFGGNPFAADRADAALTVNPATRVWSLQFLARQAGVAYTVQVSHDLRSWAAAGANEFSNLRYTALPNTGYQWITGDYTPPAGTRATFLRLRASENY